MNKNGDKKLPNAEAPENIKNEIRESETVHWLNSEEFPLSSNLSGDIYGTDDFMMLQAMDAAAPEYRAIKSLDELLERDEQREKDGFKRKVSLGKIVKPSRGGSKKVVIVPTTTEDKFYHDNRVSEEDEEKKSESSSGSGDSQDTGESAGTAEGEEGDILGERPLHPEDEGEGEGSGAGQGEGTEHEVGSSAYELGRMLTEKFKLPNLKDKGKKKAIPKYIYDLTDTNRGSGQVLDKKKTLLEILKTNISLERFDPDAPIAPENLLINPHDYVYRVLSKEKDMESQAIVFFVRDYSGSMDGKPTELVCSQHVMIFSWLMYQYREQVLTRFVVHDTEAKEVPDFYTYHNVNVAGGTNIRSSFQLVNRIIKDENLASDYNIYLFYGGDGDDWNSDKDAFVREFDDLCACASRVGLTVVRNSYSGDRETEFENFLKDKKILEKHKNLVHLDVIQEDADDKRLVEGIKELVS